MRSGYFTLQRDKEQIEMKVEDINNHPSKSKERIA